MHSLCIFQRFEGYLITRWPRATILREVWGLACPYEDFGNGDESLLLACSNGLKFSYKGNGSLAFERFEQRVFDGNLRGLVGAFYLWIRVL